MVIRGQLDASYVHYIRAYKYIGQCTVMNLDELKEKVKPFCQKYSVKRLDVFGSVARRQMNETSDLDFIVEFSDRDTQLARRYFGLLHEFEDAFRCPIDLITLNSVKNPYFKTRILQERETLYAE